MGRAPVITQQPSKVSAKSTQICEEYSWLRYKQSDKDQRRHIIALIANLQNCVSKEVRK